MSRNVVSVAVAVALLVGGAMLASESVKAGHGCGGCGGGGLFGHHRGNNCGGGLFGHHRGNNCGGGLFSHHRNNCGGAVQHGCGGGLFSRLHARKASSCCAPQPVCCTPEPVCCTPEPTCCAPQPTCCDAAPVAQSGCCGAEGVYGDSVIGGQQYHEGQPYQGESQQYQGESQQQSQPQGEVGAEAEVSSASDDVPPAPQADGASDAPPAPQPE